MRWTRSKGPGGEPAARCAHLDQPATSRGARAAALAFGGRSAGAPVARTDLAPPGRRRRAARHPSAAHVTAPAVDRSETARCVATMVTDDSVDRVCRDCGSTFEITPDERALFGRLSSENPFGTGQGWTLPIRCTPCRAARRAQQHAVPVAADAPDEWLTCRECGEGFIFGGRDREFFARRGFTTPRRCRPCRQARRAG